MSASNAAKALGLASVCAWLVACGGATAPIGGGDPQPPGPTTCGQSAGIGVRCEPPITNPQPVPPQPIDQPQPPPQPIDQPQPGSPEWQASSFTYDRAETSCSGSERYVRFDAKYGKWVGVVLCSPTRYKIFLGESATGVFHEIGDFAGNGQDHCELVNPAFTMPNEDDIKAACPSCDIQMGSWDFPGAVPVYSRANFGQPFQLGTWPPANLYTALWYECGVSIPK